MNTKKKKIEAELIAMYRASAARRREQRNLEKVITATSQGPAADINYAAGIVTIKRPANARSVSSLGGATKVFGRSSFAIPELRLYAKRATR